MLNERNTGYITDVWAKGGQGRTEPGLIDMWCANNVYTENIDYWGERDDDDASNDDDSNAELGVYRRYR